MKTSKKQKISPTLVPFPSHFTPRKGVFILPQNSKIFASVGLKNEVQYLATILRNATAYPLKITVKKEAAISLNLLPGNSMGEEGYRITVKKNGVKISANKEAGIFYGIQTLLQFLPPSIYGGVPRAWFEWCIPCVEIKDTPRFKWRGAMLDSSRHFQPVSFIKKFIDLLSYHKLNTFHWHLVDDHGWRIEIKKYPKLTKVGGWRKESAWGDPKTNAGNDDTPHGGFYTQKEIREIVAYAKERHVNIIPEIEMPGHSQAALAAYPEFGCWDGPIDVAATWGILEHNVYSPFEKTFKFLQDILTEVMDLFPSKFIHIGGDEVKKDPWLNNPKIVKRMKELGVKDGKELQSYFIKRIDLFLTSKGKRLVGWDEILEGGLAKGAVVMSWQGMEGGIAAANAGHDVIMAPTSHTYFCCYQSEIQNEPLAAYGPPVLPILTLENTYSFDPMPKRVSPSKAKHILGLQGQLWSEYLVTTNLIEYMAFPRLCALAEVAWSPRSKHRFEEFKERLKFHLKRFDQLDVKYRPLD